MTRKATKTAPAAAPVERAERPLTTADRITAFRTATGGLAKRFAAEIAAGMTDAQLEATLGDVLGIMGGSSGPGAMDVNYQGAGLRIWASWGWANMRGKPLFSGPATVAMAREVYGIANPQDRQMRLF